MSGAIYSQINASRQCEGTGTLRISKANKLGFSGKLNYDVFQTEMGWIAIVGGDNGIVRASLPESSPEAALELVSPEIAESLHDPEQLQFARVLLSAYCAGQAVDLSEVPIDTRDVSPFFRKAWEACRSIPFGETRSYQWLAEQAGNSRAARGAGQAMARNKLALLVPCHRVIASSGDLGGFGGAGLSLKSKLIYLEANR